MSTIKLQAIRYTKECSICKKQKTYYRLSGFSYGEGIVSNADGSVNAYTNLLEDAPILDEIESLCKQRIEALGVKLPDHRITKVISAVYEISCDAVLGVKMEPIATAECQFCKAKQTLVTVSEEETVELALPTATHDFWKKSEDNYKVQIVDEQIALEVKRYQERD